MWHGCGIFISMWHGCGTKSFLIAPHPPDMSDLELMIFLDQFPGDCPMPFISPCVDPILHL